MCSRIWQTSSVACLYAETVLINFIIHSPFCQTGIQAKNSTKPAAFQAHLKIFTYSTTPSSHTKDAAAAPTAPQTGGDIFPAAATD